MFQSNSLLLSLMLMLLVDGVDFRVTSRVLDQIPILLDLSFIPTMKETSSQATAFYAFARFFFISKIKQKAKCTLSAASKRELPLKPAIIRFLIRGQSIFAN